MEKKSALLGKYSVMVVAGLFYVVGLYKGALFHDLVEIFGVIVGCGIFMMAWNSREFQDNNYFLFIGIAYLFVSGLDLAHYLSRGSDLAVYSPNLSIQIRLISRYIESLSLLIAPLFVSRKLKPQHLFLGYIAIVSLLLASIFLWPVFPVCFVEGVGLTMFNKVSEYIICLIILGSIILLYQKRDRFDPGVVHLLIASFVATIGSELSFIFSSYNYFYLIGHSLQTVSFYLIYKAIIETGLMKPYRLLFRDLKQSEESLIQAKLQADKEGKERQKAEESIKAAYTELDQIFNIAADGMWVIDKDFNILKINRTLLTMVGLKEKEVVSRKCYEIFSCSICHTPDCPLNKILSKGGGRVEVDVEKKRLDGQKIPCIVTATLFQGPTGKPIGIVEDFKDITTRKAMENALFKAKEEAEARYLAMGEQAKDGVVIIQNEVWRFVNRSMAEMLGYSPDEIIGRPCGDMAVAESRDLLVHRHQSLLAGQSSPSFYEAKFQSKDGSILELEISEGVIQYQGQPATLGIFRDITQRKRTEEELLRVQKLESIGILAGGIAHDFKNILVAIIGSLSLAKLYIKPEEKLFEILARAEQASFRAKDLTQQLLTFSRGGAPIKKNASICELLKETAGFALQGSKVRCKFYLPNDLWAVEIDEGQISQVINNLIINANQAMPNGGTIQVKAENAVIEADQSLPLKEGNYIRILVKDQGSGISKEHLRKIFDPYFTTKTTGTGLGLASAYSIIKRHEGHITVESQEGVGTTFYLYLPASVPKVPTTRKKAQQHEPYAGQGKILLMDDKQGVRDVVGDMLQYIGYQVEFALDGAEAIELYQKAKESGQPFEAVIMDLTIPGGMGGEEAIQKLRIIDPEIKAIVSSGYSNAPIMSDFRRYGFSGVIPKPYQIKELNETLHKVIIDNDANKK